VCRAKSMCLHICMKWCHMLFRPGIHLRLGRLASRRGRSERVAVYFNFAWVCADA
jgi:hypothetical protein